MQVGTAFDPKWVRTLGRARGPGFDPEGGGNRPKVDDAKSRAAAARKRAERAAEAATRARARAEAATSADTVAEAEKRRLRAEERLVAARVELTKALERSRNAHLDAAQLDAERGDEDAAAEHRAAAEEDRRQQERLEG